MSQVQSGDRQSALLYEVARALTAALAPDDVAAVVFQMALSDMGASTAGFWLVDGDAVHYAGGSGHSEETSRGVGPIPLDSNLPAALCVRTGGIVAYGSVAERDERWPELTGLTSSISEAMAVVPLPAEGGVLGALHVGFPPGVPVQEMDLPLLGLLAELAGASLHRAQLYERERVQREQLAFFSEATSVLIRSLDPVELVQGLVDIAVPRLAEWCAVLVPRGETLVTVAVRIAEGDGLEAAAAAREVFPIAGDYLVSRCFRTGVVQVADPLPGAVLSRMGADTAGAVRRVGLRAAVVLPIKWGGEPIGVLSLGFTGEGRPSQRGLLETAEGLAQRAGLALHNAAMFDAERTVARTLTNALLPATVPVIPGYQSAAMYLPAAGDVAGDWYDIVELEGRFLIGVGDAAGHGFPAATLMGELRNAARGLAAARLAPSDMLDSMAALVAADPLESFATAVYGILDPTSHCLDWANAGHPPPVLVRGGRAALVDRRDGRLLQGPPICWPGRSERIGQTVHFGPGDALVLYTDGVVERRGVSLDRSFALLVALLDGTDDSPAVMIDRIVEELCTGATDDCCILVLRRDAAVP